MSIISYAQNFEDVMLWRALQHVENGFYIDIGAQDPICDSVSMAFYERGWRGVHVEPNNSYAEKIKKARPDEVVEEVAIGMGKGEIPFYTFSGTGLSTASVEISERHVLAGFVAIKTQVPVISMDSLLEKYYDKTIHWLKLDVEGHEQNVLESWRENSNRPWILVIEGTKPMTQEKNHLNWQHLVIEKGYIPVYFDGLNCFYIHENHKELITFFDAPPNIFDEFRLSGRSTNSLCSVIEAEASVRIAAAVLRAQQAESELVEVKRNASSLTVLLEQVTHSRSWRITEPLRWSGKFARRLRALARRGKISAIGHELMHLGSAAKPDAYLNDQQIRILIDLQSCITKQRQKNENTN